MRSQRADVLRLARSDTHSRISTGRSPSDGFDSDMIIASAADEPKGVQLSVLKLRLTSCRGDGGWEARGAARSLRVSFEQQCSLQPGTRSQL